MNNFSTIGEVSIWSLHKTAFLCSDKFSASSVFKCYDWASEMKRQGRCIISGFQSKLEKDVFDLLLNGSQPLIWVLARGIFEQPPQKLRPHIESGRLLIVSPFSANIHRVNRELAFHRNQYIADVADEVVFGYIHPGGMLEQIQAKVDASVLD